METEPYVALPKGGRGGPGVLVLHAWWGLNDTFRALCDRLAAEGYVALAPDLFGDGFVAKTAEEAETRVSADVDGAALPRAEAALDALLVHPAIEGAQVGVAGFSFGAAPALWLGRKRPEVGAVGAFYGTDGGAGDYKASNAAYLGHFAAGDPWEPEQVVAATEATIRRGGRPVAFHRYEGTRHWFFEPDRPEFDPAAADLAWQRTLAFLRETIGPAGG